LKQLVISKEDLIHNINRIKAFAKENSKEYTLIAVVKGNGYGLGLREYAEFLKNNGIEFFAVATLEEALELSSYNTSKNILLLSPINDKDELEKVVKNEIIVTIDSKGNAQMLNELAKNGYNIRAHLKVDTGFGRYGFLYDNEKEIVETIKSLDNNIKLEGIFSHFSISYYKNNKHTKMQYERFKRILLLLEQNNIDIKLKHICNSPAFLNYPEMHLNAARIGSAFVGRVHSENNIGLKKIGNLEVNIAEIRELPKGFNVSYLNSYKTKCKTKVAIVPIGYIEGFNVSARTDMFRLIDKIRAIVRGIKGLFKKQNLTAVIKGKRYDVIGTIGMYHIVVNITGSDISINDIVYLETNPIYVPKSIRREYK